MDMSRETMRALKIGASTAVFVLIGGIPLVGSLIDPLIGTGPAIAASVGIFAGGSSYIVDAWQL